MDYGTHCTICGKLDFLPFDCRKCNQILCADHRVHDCIEVSETISAKQLTNSASTYTKDAPRSKVNTSTAKPAPSSSQPASKPAAANKGQRLGGTSNPVKNERATAALSRLKQLIGGSKSAGSSGPKIKVREQSSRSIPPELRRNAIGNFQIPRGDRIYFLIERTEHEYLDKLTNKKVVRPSKTVCMFFDKQTTAGQILDRASKQLAVPSASLCDQNKKCVELAVPASNLSENLIIVAK